MFRKLIKNKKAQNTAEYAILIALVVAGIIAMQTYAQRAIQARVRDASVFLGQTTAFNGLNTVQYEPYYLSTDYTVTRDDSETERLTDSITAMDVNSSRSRAQGGTQVFDYDTSLPGIVNGL
jgi:Flp pilus assembly pilin Flp